MDDQDVRDAFAQSPVQELEQRLAELEEELAAKDEAYKRALADYHNVVRRAQDDRRVWMATASRDLLTDLLPTLDHLELALKHFADASLKMIVGELQRVLAQHGVERIETVGKVFDPELMEAVDAAPGTRDVVVTEQQPGYRLNGTILRHAKVVVGNGEDGAKASK